MKRLNVISISTVLCFFLSLLVTSTTFAHVKWFVPFDTTVPPHPILEVIKEPLFIGLLVFSLIVIYITTTIDRKIYPYGTYVRFSKTIERYIFDFVRYSMALTFLTVGSLYPQQIFTPELVSDYLYLKYAYYGMAFFFLFKQTVVLSCLGIFYLYFLGISEYDMFHMIDYVLYPTLAVYLLSHIYFRHKEEVMLQAVRIAVSFSFMWGAIDKFIYPALYQNLLDSYPEVQLGFEPNLLIHAAGFIEFALAFLIVTGKTAAKVAAKVLVFIVLVAIIPFGLVDAVGHMVFAIGIIAVTIAPNNYECRITAWKKTLLYLVFMVAIFALAYGSFYALNHNTCTESSSLEKGCNIRDKHISTKTVSTTPVNPQAHSETDGHTH